MAYSDLENTRVCVDKYGLKSKDDWIKLKLRIRGISR